MSDSPRNVICLVIDRLHSGFVGAYGNTWIRTPQLDRLAADSFLLDRAIIDSPRLERLYRSYWSGLHALCNPAQAGPSLDRDLRAKWLEAGYHTALVTDDSTICGLPPPNGFKECHEIGDGRVVSPHVQESAEDTALARFFTQAVEHLGQMPEPFCLWLHTGSLGTVWDAPSEFREQYADEDDPPSSQSANVPCQRLPKNFDPDELVGLMHAYAGQVSLLDICIGSLLDALAESAAARNTLVVVLSARGFPLGEHGRVGPVDEALFGELVQIPWLLRFPDGQGAGDRSQALVQPADLCATLVDWCGLPGDVRQHPAAGRSLLPLVTGAANAVRDRSCIIAPPHEGAIITPGWSMRIASGDAGTEAAAELPTEPAAGEKCELFAKPDDRFEANEVSDRGAEVVADLRTAFIQFQQSCQSAEPAELPPLPEVLVSGF